VTGPEHYRMAERLLTDADSYEDDGALAMARERRSEALVRALLANAAAAVEQAGIGATAHDVRSEALNEWFDAINPQEAS
jgi:hypothetical protein